MYKNTGYGIGSDSVGEYSLPDGSVGKKLPVLKLIWVHLHIFIINEKISSVFVNDQLKYYIVLHLQQKQNILLVLHNQEKHLHQVNTIMEVTVLIR